ncbi:MAG: enoyl-CoA hydratase/isomerase family protein [Pseudomonadales bacterium]|nr:enoyl-CoA hydratase/isomerase family protein [Pseudomonadales bacterium]
MSEDVVLFETLPAGNRKIGVATLNAPKTLNSLSLEMIDKISPQLDIWAADDEIVMVLFQSMGEKAFSAGGDIQDLYRSMVAHPGGPNPYADAFFEREYRLDYKIHTYSKPVMVWAHGIVMGGGLGVMAACSHRVGTEKSRIAMPEITIGLFPDAGATWFLAQMEEHWAYYLAWTGTHMNGPDAKRVGFVDHLVDAAAKDELIRALQQLNWTTDHDENRHRLSQLIGEFEARATEMPASSLDAHDEAVRALIGESLQAAEPHVAFLNGALASSDEWIARGGAGLQGGAPTTASIVTRQIREARALLSHPQALREIFKLELIIAVQCSRHPEFAEGIRALLIDKDGKPAWQYPDFSAVPDSWIEEHFTAPWAVHPLDDLPA